jgi:predicted anti-sigma-YlaC factor YlaD
MNQHDEIRPLLALAAAGDMQPDEQRQVNEHLRDCVACTQELAALGALAAGLRTLPSPEMALGLAERTRARVAAELGARVERRRHYLLVGLLLAFGWALTLLSIAGARYFGDDLARLLRVSVTEFEVGFIGYALFAASATALLAGLAGPRHEAQRRAS